jgi:hypothetical protein
MPAFNKATHLNSLPLVTVARYHNATSAHGRVPANRNLQSYAQPPTRTEHRIAILAHVVGVPGTGCQRRAASASNAAAGRPPRVMEFEDEIVYIGTDPRGNPVLRKCTTCEYASDGGACGSVPVQGPLIPPPPPPAPLVQQPQAGPSRPSRPSRNASRPQHQRQESGASAASADSLGSATSYHFNLAGRLPSPDPDYRPGRDIGPTPRRPATRQQAQAQRPHPAQQPQQPQHAQPPQNPQPHQRAGSGTPFYDAPGSPMHDPDEGFNVNQHGIPPHLRTFGVREFSPIPSENDPQHRRRLTERNLRQVPGVDFPAEWAPGDTTGYFEEDQTRSEYRSLLDNQREARLRDINSRRRALARARTVGLDAAERELQEELERLLQEQSDDVLGSKMKEHQWMHKKRDDGNGKPGGAGGAGGMGGMGMFGKPWQPDPRYRY